MIMYDSDIVCGKYDENLAMCIVTSAHVTTSKAIDTFQIMIIAG